MRRTGKLKEAKKTEGTRSWEFLSLHVCWNVRRGELGCMIVEQY